MTIINLKQTVYSSIIKTNKIHNKLGLLFSKIHSSKKYLQLKNFTVCKLTNIA